MEKGFIKKMFFIALVPLFLVVSSFSELVMFDYSTDPGIIVAGDQVDIIVSFKETPFSKIDYGNYYSYKFKLEPADSAAKEYIYIIDAFGDELAFLDSGKVWNVRFKIKIASNAKPGIYKLKLYIEKYDNNGNKLISYSKDIFIEVKKIGSDVVLGTIITDPYEIRVGDDLVNLNIEVANIGNKVAKGITVIIDDIEGVFEHKYATNSKKFIPVLNPYESKYLVYQFEVKEKAKPGVYKLPYTLYWKDEDNNQYSYKSEIEIKIKGKPILIVEKSEGTAKIGGKGKLYIYVKNIGEEKAENVRVKIIKDSSLPLSIDDRSLFLGDLKPGETTIAVFDVKVDRFAKEATYNLKVMLSGKGDTDENDDRIYTYYREASFEVKGKETNKVYYVALAVGVVLLLYLFILTIKKIKNKNESQ